MTAALVIYGAGPRDPEALKPQQMQFTTRPANSCRGCLFSGQWWRVCREAGIVAALAGLDECEAGNVIYVAKEIDPRQLAIEGAAPCL